MLGGGDGRDAINCVSTAKHKKGRTRFIKGANMIIIRDEHKVRPYGSCIECLYWV